MYIRIYIYIYTLLAHGASGLVTRVVVSPTSTSRNPMLSALDLGSRSRVEGLPRHPNYPVLYPKCPRFRATRALLRGE